MLPKLKQVLDKSVEPIVESQTAEVEESPDINKGKVLNKKDENHEYFDTDVGVHIITNEDTI